MSERVRGIVVSHGQVAEALVAAVRQITGDADVLTPVTNTGCDRKRLVERLETAVGDGPALVLVDLPSGSCLQAAVTCLRTHEEVAVVAGVNLAMLIDFVMHRDATPAEAAERAVGTGARAIRVLERP